MGLRQKSSLKSLGKERDEKLKTKQKAPHPGVRYPLFESSPSSVKIIRKDPLLSILLDEPPKGDGLAEKDSRSASETVVKVEKAINSLGQLESEVVSALFPADGSAPASFEAIAQRLGMTAEEVKGIADNALRGLRGSRGQSRLSNAWN
jgi:hypothetical protein